MNRMWSLVSLTKFGAAGMACALVLAGCDDFNLGTNDATESATVSTAAGRLRIEERDVEAPDVFSLRAKGLWDGRPSLGGIWVAVPQRVDPDRVKITNLDTGRSVVGGLFRKEVDTPGPAILVSSDAAAAIGMQAGSPADMQLVVLRRETVEIAPPAPEAIEAAETAPVAAAPEVATDAAPVAAAGLATAALVTTPLDEAAVAAEPLAEAPQPVAAASPPAEPAPSVSPASELERPYIQVATVSSPASANAIIKKLQAAGLSGELRIGQSGGKTIFSVVIGPASDATARTETLRKVRGLGYSDAYPV